MTIYRPHGYIVDSQYHWESRFPTVWTISIDHTDKQVAVKGKCVISIRHCRYCCGSRILAGFMPHVTYHFGTGGTMANGQPIQDYQKALDEGLKLAETMTVDLAQGFAKTHPDFYKEILSTLDEPDQYQEEILQMLAEISANKQGDSNEF